MDKIEERINATYWWKIGENGLAFLWAHKALEEGMDHLDVCAYLLETVVDGSSSSVSKPTDTYLRYGK